MVLRGQMLDMIRIIRSMYDCVNVTSGPVWELLVQM